MEALDMKAVLYSAIFAVLAATPVLSADSVSLVGTWTGQRDRIAKVEGRRGGLATLVITEQQGNTFVGRLKRSNPTGDEDEPLWGAFTPGGKLMMGSDDEGTYIFSLIDQNTLDYCYSETGSSPRSVCGVSRLCCRRPVQAGNDVRVRHVASRSTFARACMGSSISEKSSTSVSSP
jgi:hypothetical protein